MDKPLLLQKKMKYRPLPKIEQEKAHHKQTQPLEVVTKTPPTPQNTTNVRTNPPPKLYPGHYPSEGSCVSPKA